MSASKYGLMALARALVFTGAALAQGVHQHHPFLEADRDTLVA